jgi:electron transfer flavoprotein beta subunit
VKIAVCVKEVPEAGAARRIDPQTKRLDRSGEGALNAFDVNAVEEALRLKESLGESEIVVVSLGPEGALDSLRKALAMGADRALLVSDEAAAGSDLLATSRALEAAELTVAGGKATVKRQTEFGYDRIEAPLPAVVAVSDAINEPRYPSLKGIMGAKSKPQDLVSASELGLGADTVGEAGSKTEVLALNDPPPRGESRKLEDDGTAAQQILDFLVKKKLI